MSTQEYKISPKRSTHIRSRPDMASSNSFFVPPDLAERGLNSVHPFPLVMDADKRPRGRRPAPIAWAEYPRLEVNPPNAYSVVTLDVDDVHNLPERAWRMGKPSLPPHMDSPVARHRQDALRLHSRNTRASKPRLTGRAAIEAGRRCRPTRHPWNSCEWPASARRRARRGEEDTTGQLDFGHCFECGYHIASSAEPEWTAAVRAKCPNCGRPW